MNQAAYRGSLVYCSSHTNVDAEQLKPVHGQSSRELETWQEAVWRGSAWRHELESDTYGKSKIKIMLHTSSTTSWSRHAEFEEINRKTSCRPAKPGDLSPHHQHRSEGPPPPSVLVFKTSLISSLFFFLLFLSFSSLVMKVFTPQPLIQTCQASLIMHAGLY